MNPTSTAPPRAPLSEAQKIELRATALAHAVSTLSGTSNATAVLSAASAYYNFLLGSPAPSPDGDGRGG